VIDGFDLIRRLPYGPIFRQEDHFFIYIVLGSRL
jgi:hypothetical protein